MLAAEVQMRSGLLTLLLMLSGCGTIVLERFHDTGDLVDPFRLCTHVDDELNLCTNGELSRNDCMRECADAGGQTFPPWNSVDTCLHAPGVELNCASLQRCMRENGVACATDTAP